MDVGILAGAAVLAAAATAVTPPFVLAPLAEIAAAGDARGEVVEPSGLAVDAFGRVVVADAALHRLQRFDRDGRWLDQTGGLGSEPGRLRRPGAVCTFGATAIAVLDRENRRIESYDLYGRRVATVLELEDAAVVERLGRVEPVAIAADRGGALFVADADRDRVLVFDFSGRPLRTLGGFGARPGSFRGVAGLAVTPLGDLVVAERGNARVQHLDAGGRVLALWELPVRGARGSLPVAVSDSGAVAVADERGGGLWVWSGAGGLLATLAGLERPRALAFAGDGTLLVAEAGRVRRFALRAAPTGAAGGRDD